MKLLNSKFFQVLLVTSIACVTSLFECQASEVYSTLGVADSGHNTRLGQSFKVHKQSVGVALGGIRLRSAATLGDKGSHIFRAALRLYSSTSANVSEWEPGVLLAESNQVQVDPEKDGMSSVYAFTFNKDVTLQPNAVYLVEIVNVNDPEGIVRVGFGEDLKGGDSEHGCAFVGVGTAQQRCFEEYDFGLEVVTKLGVVAPKRDSMKVLLNVSGVSIGLQQK